MPLKQTLYSNELLHLNINISNDCLIDYFLKIIYFVYFSCFVADPNPHAFRHNSMCSKSRHLYTLYSTEDPKCIFFWTLAAFLGTTSSLLSWWWHVFLYGKRYDEERETCRDINTWTSMTHTPGIRRIILWKSCGDWLSSREVFRWSNTWRTPAFRAAPLIHLLLLYIGWTCHSTYGLWLSKGVRHRTLCFQPHHLTESSAGTVDSSRQRLKSTMGNNDLIQPTRSKPLFINCELMSRCCHHTQAAVGHHTTPRIIIINTKKYSAMQVSVYHVHSSTTPY